LILFNFDFFNTELRNHTMDYVKKEYKEELEKKCETRGLSWERL